MSSVIAQIGRSAEVWRKTISADEGSDTPSLLGVIAVIQSGALARVSTTHERVGGRGRFVMGLIAADRVGAKGRLTLRFELPWMTSRILQQVALKYRHTSILYIRP